MWMTNQTDHLAACWEPLSDATLHCLRLLQRDDDVHVNWASQAGVYRVKERQDARHTMEAYSRATCGEGNGQ